MKLYQIITEGWKQKQIANLSRKSIERLRAAGMIPSAKAYAAGLNRGTDSIAAKTGAKLGTKMAVLPVHHVSQVSAMPHVGVDNMTTSYRFLPKNADHTKAIYRPFKKSSNEYTIRGHKTPIINGNKDLVDSLVRRHETDELAAGAKIAAPHRNTPQIDKAINAASGYQSLGASFESGKGSGHLPGVIAKEKRISDVTKNAYGTGIKRRPEELSLDMNSTDPKRIKQLIKQYQKVPKALTQDEKIQLIKDIDTELPKHMAQTVKYQTRVVPQLRK